MAVGRAISAIGEAGAGMSARSATTPVLGERAREILLYLVSAATAVLAATLSLRAWLMDLSKPIAYDADAVSNLAAVKAVLEHGWFLSNPLLGAPNGQEYYDYKVADTFHFFVIWLMRPFTSDAAVATNVYFLIGFPLIALTMTYFLRDAGVRRSMAGTLAVLFAIAPYHFLQGENHLWLASYYVVPLALAMIYRTIRRRPLWHGRGLLGVPTPVVTAVTVVLVATSNSYYTVFALLLFAAAALIASVRSRRALALVPPALTGVAIVAVYALNLLPDTIYTWQHGPNPEAVVRAPQGVETYSLKLIQLLLPMPGHRIPLFADVRNAYDTLYGGQAENPVLGLVAGSAFIVAIAFALYSLATLRRGRRRGPLADAVGALATLIIIAFILGTLGGLSSVISLVTSDLRTWSRISIFIAGLSLAVAGLLLDVVWSRLAVIARHAVNPRVVAIMGAILVLVVGAYDQTSGDTEPNYAGTAARYSSDAALVASIEASAGADASILQLPFRAFPETFASTDTVYDTEQLKPSLHSTTLSWSGGAIKGRPAGVWVDDLQRLPAGDLVDVATAVGFAGILIDTHALDDDGRTREANITALLGPPVVQSGDGRYHYYSLDADRAEIAKRWSAAQIAQIGASAPLPVDVSFLPNPSSFTMVQALRGVPPHFTLENDRGTAVDVRIDFFLTSLIGNGGASDYTYTTSDGQELPVSVNADTGVASLTVTVEPGQSSIAIARADGVPLELGKPWGYGPVTASAIQVTDLGLADLLSTPRP